jgi:hypothetical protein
MPNGVELPVRLACFSLILSSKRYINWKIPTIKQVEGFNLEEKSKPPSLYEMTAANILNNKAIKVIKFGASQLGSNSTTLFKHGEMHELYNKLSSLFLHL